MSGMGIYLNLDVPNMKDIDVYIKNGGYQALEKVLKEMQPSQVTDTVKASGLRGRGGAGFPTGVKWGFVPANINPKYVVCNCDESEPGTFKDRKIIEHNPHQLVEGIAIAAYAIGAVKAFAYLRGEFAFGAKVLQDAVDQAYARGYLGKNILGSDFSLDMVVHRGAGAYICGEESAQLESLEGKRGYPRLRPPFPAVSGVYAKPTLINNCETLSTVPLIVKNGAEWYTQWGTEKSKGTRAYSLSGHVNKPGTYDLPMNTTLRQLIEDYGGGVPGGKKVKAVIPGGSSAAMLPASMLDTPIAFDELAAAGSMGGSGAVVVMDEDTDIVRATLRIHEFYREESCGKCTPCREGTFWLVQIIERIVHGGGLPGDVEKLLDICSQIGGRAFCLLADGAIPCIISSIKYFREEYEYYIQHGHSMYDDREIAEAAR